ncbi:4446_t:CDS:2 [Acaulospora colombiana]|uniref:4446_t:CDS:1 n=1 Tax=Acaulospora colombiana TaxID=27376 RepID=A0ACA9LCK5_9GLOM|nr:4446_t:CDS:2 [Acaulospora colombiana]
MIKNFISNFNLPTGSTTNLAASLNNSDERVSDITANDDKSIDSGHDYNNSVHIENFAARNKIVLNVGGIKYETYRSTLTSYPTTLLGSIFRCDDNQNPFFDPAHENEFFIDRDATTLSPNQLSLRHKMIASEIDSFIKTLTDALLTISSQFKKDFFFRRQFLIRLDITFHHNERVTDFNIMPSINSALKQQLMKNFESSAALGYAILDRFGDEIGRIRVGVENSFENEEDIIGNCCLAAVGSESELLSPADSILKD